MQPGASSTPTVTTYIPDLHCVAEEARRHVLLGARATKFTSVVQFAGVLCE